MFLVKMGMGILLLKIRNHHMKVKYRCQKCLFYFELDNPGPTQCPKCGHLYVDWLNHVEVLKSLNLWKN